MSIRVLLVDDQALVRAGFRMILDAEEDIEVVGEAADGEQAVFSAEKFKPDVILMDVRMPNMDGIEATRRIVGAGDGAAAPAAVPSGDAEGEEPVADPALDRPRVLMLTTFELDEYVYESLRAGASGFLLKDVPADQLVAGIRVIASGEALLAPSVTRRLISDFSAARAAQAIQEHPPAGLDELTAREMDVFKAIARGLSNAEIAAELVVSETTVKTHVARILMKLGLRDRVQAVVLAYESGLVQPGSN
jgi:DNA-binding NarL/FixJ family response regulator